MNRRTACFCYVPLCRTATHSSWRRPISSTRNHVLSLVDLALAQELAGEDWPAAAAKAGAAKAPAKPKAAKKLA